MSSRRIVFAALLVMLSSFVAFAQPPKVRLSAWYWLNSAPKNEWQSDFADMKRMGFTDVLMCWGLDLGGVVTRKHETTEAIAMAKKAGLGTYLIVWQPTANALKRDPKYMQVDSTGKAYDRFDVFNREWRSTEWKDYLEDVARTYGHQPGFSGYVFDDSFGASGTISYGAYEEKVFGAPLPRKPSDPRWAEWTKARQQWWEDWAIDTMKYIRAVDPDTSHIVYIEDSLGSITNPERPEGAGLDFGRAARHFDAVGIYQVPTWTSDPDSVKKVSAQTAFDLNLVRKAVGPNVPMVFTFWVANHIEERNPGPAVHPTAAEIEDVCNDALHLGVKHLDMYGYRIGEYQVTREQMKQMMPPEPAPYTITGQFPHKFLYDRPEVKKQLGEYLRSLNK